VEISEILSHVDHTLLKPEATERDIEKLCREALELHTACVCINPRYIPLALSIVGDKVPVCAVIGFPLGAMTTEAKAAIWRGGSE